MNYKIVLLAFIFISLTNCKDNDDDLPKEMKYSGTWHLKEVSVSKKNEKISFNLNDVIWTFMGDTNKLKVKDNRITTTGNEKAFLGLETGVYDYAFKEIDKKQFLFINNKKYGAVNHKGNTFIIGDKDVDRSVSMFISTDKLIVDEKKYDAITTNNYEIKNVSLYENLLTIEVAASGCSGDNWKVGLVDSGLIKESKPPKRAFKVFLDNNEKCTTVIVKEFTFDISILKETTIFRIKKWSESLVYKK